MSNQSHYLDRYAWSQPLFSTIEIHPNTGLIIVIPAYNESTLDQAIHALQKCNSPECEVLIIVVINEPDEETSGISARNEQAFLRLQQVNGPYRILSRLVKLPPKKAGVGLARKIGMDEAVRLYDQIGEDGVITCFDADCTCDNNFMIEVYDHFRDPAHHTGLVFYEHPVDRENEEAIINYELYLRYYINILRWAGFPYAFQTLGSCISVRSSSYQKQGGMNTRKAGEDFYFIHKMTALGGMMEINSTTVYPSPRISDRVPFGTGHAIHQFLQDKNEDYPVYAPIIFERLKKFLEQISVLYTGQSINKLSLSKDILSFLESQEFEHKLEEMCRKTASYEAFRKRFFTWFDGLKVLKLIHYLRDHYHRNVPLDTAISWIDLNYFHHQLSGKNRKEILLQLRNLDHQCSYHIK